MLTLNPADGASAKPTGKKAKKHQPADGMPLAKHSHQTRAPADKAPAVAPFNNSNAAPPAAVATVDGADHAVAAPPPQDARVDEPVDAPASPTKKMKKIAGKVPQLVADSHGKWRKPKGSHGVNWNIQRDYLKVHRAEWRKVLVHSLLYYLLYNF